MTASTSRLYRSAPHVRPLARRPAAAPARPASTVGDDRWPAIVDALAALRDAGRYSVRIVDADCGAGGLLLRAVRHARALGFTAIEGRGIDGAPALIARAKALAATLRDPATGVTFETADLLTALADEADLPVDIILWHGMRGGAERPALRKAIAAAGRCVIVDATCAGAASWGAEA